MDEIILSDDEDQTVKTEPEEAKLKYEAPDDMPALEVPEPQAHSSSSSSSLTTQAWQNPISAPLPDEFWTGAKLETHQPEHSPWSFASSTSSSAADTKPFMSKADYEWAYGTKAEESTPTAPVKAETTTVKRQYRGRAPVEQQGHTQLLAEVDLKMWRPKERLKRQR